MPLSPTVLYALSAVLAVLGAGLLYFIRATSPSGKLEGAGTWLGVVVSGAVVVFAVGLGVVTFLQARGADFGPDRNVIGRAAPDLTFRLVETDAPQRLSDYAGQVVLLNLWATWCAPCLAELPELNRLQQTLADRGVTVITISDEPRESLQLFQQERPLRTVSGYLPDAVDWPAPYDRVEGARPTTFVIDRQGVIRATWPGAGDYEQFVAAVQAHL